MKLSFAACARKLLLVSTSFTVALLAVAAPGASSAAAASMTAHDLSAYVTGYAHGWNQLSNSDGTFRDPMSTPRPAGYGNTMLGAVFVREGLRTGNQDLVDRGILAFDQTIYAGKGMPFDMLALPETYRLLSSTQQDNPLWASRRGAWDGYLQSYAGPPSEELSSCFFQEGCFNNWFLVDALGKLELLSTGVQGVGSAITANPHGHTAHAVNVINSLAVQKAAPFAAATPYGTARYLSDDGPRPMAYAVFTALHLSTLQYRYPHVVQSSLPVETARHVLAAQAPDGDNSYTGRSYQQSWVLAAQVLLGLQSARNDPQNAAAYLKVSRRAWALLRRDHPTVHGTIATTRSSAGGSYAGADGYATQIAYNGLTMLLLSQAVDVINQNPGWPLTPQPQDSAVDTASFLSANAGIAWRSNNKVWMTVHRQPSEMIKDARYTDGLTQIKAKVGGQWVNVTDGLPRANAPAGIQLTIGGRTGTMRLREIQRHGSGFTAAAEFRSGYRVIYRIRVYWQLAGSTVTVKLRVPKGATVKVAQAVSGGTVNKRGYLNSRLKLRFNTPMTKVSKSTVRPTALSASSRTAVWSTKKLSEHTTFTASYTAR